VTVFEYLSVFVSIVVGLGVANLLLGVERILTGPRDRVSMVHLGWVAMVLLLLIFFWWFNFQWDRQAIWSFGLFVWVVCYAMLMFFVATLAVPGDRDDDANWGDWFFERRRIFFTTVGLAAIADVVDFIVRNGVDMAVASVAMFTPQALSVVIAVVLARTSSRRILEILTVVHLVILVTAVLTMAGTVGV